MGRLAALFVSLALAGCGPLVWGPPPRIESFTADTGSAGWGDEVQLGWHVVGASEFFLSGVGPVGSSGAVVRPTGITAYELTAHGLGGTTVSAKVFVDVRASLRVSAGLYTDGGALGTVFLARQRDAAGAAPAEAASIVIEAIGPGFPLRFSCAAGALTCELRAPQVPPVAGYRATSAGTRAVGEATIVAAGKARNISRAARARCAATTGAA